MEEEVHVKQLISFVGYFLAHKTLWIDSETDVKQVF